MNRSWDRLGGAWRGFGRGAAVFVLGAVASAALVGGSVGLSGGRGATADERAVAPATWTAADRAVAIPADQTGRTAVAGAPTPVRYAFGVDYAGVASGDGAAISGSGLPGGLIRVLAGDTVSGSAAAWGAATVPSPDGAAGSVGSAGAVSSAGAGSTAEQLVWAVGSASADLGGQLTVSDDPQADPSDPPSAGGSGAAAARTSVAGPPVRQARWQIVDADPAKVRAEDGGPATLAAGWALDEPARAEVGLLVLDPALSVAVEVCATGTDCDPGAARGTGGWSEHAERGGPVAARVWADNTGNVALRDAQVATATANGVSVPSVVGTALGELAVGGSASAVFAVSVSTDTALAVSVSATFDGDGPDGTPLANRFTDASGAAGRVPSDQAAATISAAISATGSQPESGGALSADNPTGSASPSDPPSVPSLSEPSSVPSPSARPTGGVSAGGPGLGGPGLGSPGFGGPGIMPLDGELQVVGITAALNTAVTPASQQSGSTWQYLISLSCGAVVGSPCDDLVVTIPIPAVPTATGAWTSWATPTVTGDATLISGGASAVAVSGGNWVITLGRSLDPGEAPVLTLSVTVPNYTTPNNFQWQLRPSVSGSNVATVTVPAATAVATSTAVGACVATPASATAATQVLGPIAATRNFWAVWYFTTNAAATGQLSPTPGSTMTGTVSYTAYLSYAGSDASAPTSTPSGVIGTDNPAGRVLTYQVAIGSSTPIVGSTIWAQPQFTLNTVGTFTVTFGGSYLPVGAASPINCSLGQSYQITNNVISGQIFIKNSQGYTATGPTSAMGTAGTAGGNFAMAPKEDRPTNGMDFWSIYLYRNNATLQAMHLFDGMPCLTSGTGLTTAAAYQSLAEPAVCAQPAFHMTVVVLSGDALDGQQVTFVYSDGTSAVIPMTTTGTVTGPGSTRVLCTASSPCLIPDPGKMVASVVVDGSYNVDDASSYKAILLYGWPVASLPSTSSRYLRNVATLTSRASPAQFATTAVSVGMYTPADSVLLVGQTTSTAYTYSGSWSGSTTNSPCNYAVCNSANYNAGVWAYSSDPSLDAQRRTAVVFPAGSGVTLTAAGVQPYTTYGTPAVYGPAVSPVVGNYGGFGAGTTLYSFDASSVNGVAVPNGAGVGVRVSYGGMAPGVYVYYTYTGLTDTNPTDSGATCTATNASVVSDATGIIGPVGVTRQLCRSTNTIIVQSPSAGINVSKMVRDVTAGTDYVASPGVLDALPGDQVQFRIRISNTGPAALSNVYVYDILPYIGDTGIMGSLVGQARGTTNNINLASLPTAPTGWTLTYNTSTNPCRPEVWIPPAASGTATPTGCANTWSTAGNVTTARAVRMFIASLPVATVSVPYYDLLLTYTVPPAASWVLGNVEWNTVAVGGTYGSLTLSPTESPKVGFRFPPSALVWRKIDSSTRDPLAGASFRVTGPGGYTQDVTDNDSVDADPTAGGFKLTGLAAGTYAITETAAPAGFALNTTTYHVTIGAPGLTGDGGDIPDDLLPKTVTVYLAKLGQDSGGAWVALSGSDWQVLADDHGSAGAPDASVSVTGTGEPGMFEISGLTAGAWWLTETRAPAGYALLAAPVQFTVSATGVVALGAGASANITAAAGSPAQAPWWVITVRDVRAMALPPAGGAGQRGAWAAGGGLLSASLVLGVVLAVADRRRLARR